MIPNFPSKYLFFPGEGYESRGVSVGLPQIPHPPGETCCESPGGQLAITWAESAEVWGKGTVGPSLGPQRDPYAQPSCLTSSGSWWGQVLLD